MVTCSHCNKSLDREAYCSGACKVAFFRSKKIGTSDSKKISIPKVDPIDMNSTTPMPKVKDTIGITLITPYSETPILQRVAKVACPAHTKWGDGWMESCVACNSR